MMEKRIRAVGVIIPTSWDHSGHPMDYAFYSSDETVYPLNDDFHEGRIEDLMHQLIQIKGILNKKRLNVEEIKILGSKADTFNGAQ